MRWRCVLIFFFFCYISEFICELPLIYWRKLRCLYYVIGLSLVAFLFFSRTIISFGKPKPCLATPLPLSLFAKPRKVYVWTLCFKANQETPRQNNSTHTCHRLVGKAWLCVCNVPGKSWPCSALQAPHHQSSQVKAAASSRAWVS